MIGWSRRNLSDAAGLAERTIIDFERGARNPIRRNMEAIKAALETAGVEFIPENGGGPGVRLRK